MAERGNTSSTRRIVVPRREWKAVPTDPRPTVDLLVWAGWPLGGELIIVGLVALARAGFGDANLFDPTVSVGPWHVTRLAALISIAFGLMIWYGVAGTADDIGLRVLGALMLVVGIVWIIEPGGFNPWLGTETADGIHYTGIGAILIGLSLIPPFHIGRKPVLPE